MGFILEVQKVSFQSSLLLHIFALLPCCNTIFTFPYWRWHEGYLRFKCFATVRIDLHDIKYLVLPSTFFVLLSWCQAKSDISLLKCSLSKLLNINGLLDYKTSSYILEMWVYLYWRLGSSAKTSLAMSMKSVPPS